MSESYTETHLRLVALSARKEWLIDNLRKAPDAFAKMLLMGKHQGCSARDRYTSSPSKAL